MLEGEFLLCPSLTMFSHLERSELGSAMLQFPKHMYSLQVLAMALVSKAQIYMLIYMLRDFSLSFPCLFIPYCWQLLMMIRKL